MDTRFTLWTFECDGAVRQQLGQVCKTLLPALLPVTATPFSTAGRVNWKLWVRLGKLAVSKCSLTFTLLTQGKWCDKTDLIGPTWSKFGQNYSWTFFATVLLKHDWCQHLVSRHCQSVTMEKREIADCIWPKTIDVKFTWSAISFRALLKIYKGLKIHLIFDFVQVFCGLKIKKCKIRNTPRPKRLHCGQICTTRIHTSAAGVGISARAQTAWCCVPLHQLWCKPLGQPTV